MLRQKNLPQDRNSSIGHETSFIGDISTDADLRIDGTLNGNILKANRLIIGKDGFVNGNAHCLEAEILGKVTGKLVVENLLHLHDRAVINGDIDAGSLRLESESVYNGYLRTGTAVATVRAINEVIPSDDGVRRRRLL
jgi:cytoskeletal protein CcmA (bactofilin family)